MIKTLQVNGYESPGKRFNGLSISGHLRKMGIDSTHLVWSVDTKNPNVISFGGNFTKFLNYLIRKIEWYLSIQSILYPHALQMFRLREFKEADIIHLHIIHSGYFSFLNLPMLTRKKPTVWTIHDPWALTGHCIYPTECNKWKTGCGGCPNLASQLPLLFDTTKYLFNFKKSIYKKSKLEIVVASNWMKNIIEASPMFGGIKINMIPFGVDLNFFSPGSNPNARNRFNIDDRELVILFRALDNDIKGFQYIVESLKLIHSSRPITLLTLNQTNLLKEFEGRFRVIDLGWQNDDYTVRDAYLAADIFLMPSTGEAFGMMAIEAMACARPVVVFEGTALPETCFAPDVGLAVPFKDHVALSKAIQSLIDFPENRLGRGKKGRELAELHYDEKLYANRIAGLYNSVLKK
jgi:glycosyltransferase involved in cell wall biosynthesis